MVKRMNSTASEQPHRFPRTSGGLFMLRCFVVAPAVAILGCVGVLASGKLSPRSPYISTLTLIIDAMSVVEIVSFVIFLRSLVKSYIARTPSNWVITVLGGVSLLPALIVAILIVEGSFRHPGA
jgi:hypothetical protein